MLAEKWNRKTRTYEKITVPGEDQPVFADMTVPITCPHCGKEFPFGDGYTSLELFRPGGAFGYYVCPECYEEEKKREREGRG